MIGGGGGNNDSGGKSHGEADGGDDRGKLHGRLPALVKWFALRPRLTSIIFVFVILLLRLLHVEFRIREEIRRRQAAEEKVAELQSLADLREQQLQVERQLRSQGSDAEEQFRRLGAHVEGLVQSLSREGLLAERLGLELLVSACRSIMGAWC